MTIHPGSTALLAAIPRVLDGIAVRLVDADGAATATFGVPAAANASEVRAELPIGAVVASCPSPTGAVHELVQALLSAVAERERLEDDMESMNTSSLRLLEQVSMFGETLPRLSAGGDDAEIATQGVRACQRATGVQQVVYLGYVPAKEGCEIIVHYVGDAPGAVRVQPSLDHLVAANEGLLAEVLAVEEGIVLRSVPEG
ncbi:MAG: hypothetical protein ABIP94_18295, partial [Planctomycetota bacterium]